MGAGSRLTIGVHMRHNGYGVDFWRCGDSVLVKHVGNGAHAIIIEQCDIVIA